MPASSQASRALSTASLTQVSNAFRGLSKPSKWRFLVKNSETDISRCRAPISAADTATLGSGGCVSATAALDFSIGLDILFGSVVRLLVLWDERSGRLQEVPGRQRIHTQSDGLES